MKQNGGRIMWIGHLRLPLPKPPVRDCLPVRYHADRIQEHETGTTWTGPVILERGPEILTRDIWEGRVKRSDQSQDLEYVVPAMYGEVEYFFLPGDTEPRVVITRRQDGSGTIDV